MKELGLLALGLAGGVLLGMALRPASEASCCQRVAAGVRTRVADEFGEGAARVGDAFDLWKSAPSLLDLFGVPVDA